MLVCKLKQVIGAAAVTPYKSLPSVRLNVVRTVYKGSMGSRQNGGSPYMVSQASGSLFWPTGCRGVFLVELRDSQKARVLSRQIPQ